MGDIAEAFEQHLRSLSDDDWTALVSRVRQPAQQPSPTLPNEVDPVEHIGAGRNAGLAEAKRRGYIDDDGNQ